MTLHFVEPRIERPKLIEPVINLGATIRPEGNPATWLTMDPAGVHDDLHKWTFGAYREANTNVAEGLQTYTQGINITPQNGAQIDATKTSYCERAEIHWENPNDSNRIWDEYHHIWADAGGRTRRVISHSFKGGDVRTLDLAFTTQQFRIYGAADGTTEYFRLSWLTGQESFFLTPTSNATFDLYGGGDTSGATGRIMFNPTSSGNKRMQFSYIGGSDEVFAIAAPATANAPDRFLFGTRGGGDDAYLQLRDLASGIAVGVGVDPGSSAAAGTLHFADGGAIVGQTTTGLKILTATTQKLGFHNASPVAQQTVTGSRGANAALASLCTALASLGLIVDGTS